MKGLVTKDAQVVPALTVKPMDRTVVANFALTDTLWIRQRHADAAAYVLPPKRT